MAHWQALAIGSDINMHIFHRSWIAAADMLAAPFGVYLIIFLVILISNIMCGIIST